MLPPDRDPIGPADAAAIGITVDGQALRGIDGQSIAGVLLASGRLAWRTTAAGRRPRGVFCGIGVCFDCLVTVNGLRDVRACQRLARDGDIVTVQDEELPAPRHEPGGAHMPRREEGAVE
jgi:hypothetical protein